MAKAALVGQILDGKYSIEKPLGKGGMGTVYLATHVGTGRPVAVKVIAPDFMERAEFVERFRREAQAAGRLRHPNVVDVTDFGFSSTADGPDVAYLVMEYLDGCTLGEVLDEEKQLPAAWSIDIIEQVCSAVDEAHKQGIIHRDLKPDNIWLEPNQRGGYTVKVLDFGIAKLEESQLANAAVKRLPHVPGRGETRAGSAPSTIADVADAATYVDEGAQTIVSENETLALDGGASEAEEGSASKVSLEGGTVLMHTSGTGSDPSLEDKRTRVDGQPSTNKQDRTTPSTAALTRMGAVLGTPLYMSPEQCRGEKLTPQSDIYSLAVIVYQMFSGETPFTGDYIKVMEGHKNEAPPPLHSLKIRRKLKDTVVAGLAKHPSERPATAEAFASKLRANSEGLGSLLTKGLVIFGERLPKLLLMTLITFSIPILLNFLRVGMNVGLAVEYYSNPALFQALSVILSFVTFFLQVAATAVLVGMTTWVVGQVLAYPLRPLSLWAAFREARLHLKSLIGTVTISTLITAAGYVIGFVGVFAFILIILFAPPQITMGVAPIAPGVLLLPASIFFLALSLSALFMLIAPSIMMEGTRGMAAFRRSVNLTRRSFSTVFAVSLIVFLTSAIIPVLLGLSISSIVGNYDKSQEIARMKEEGVKPAAELEKEQKAKETDEAKEDEGNLNFSWGSKGLVIGDSHDVEEEKDKSLTTRTSIVEASFELIWTPIHLLIITFFSVISGLIYFKTRQAGGESMQELLSRLNNANCPQSNWQERVNRRLIQSGKISSGSNGP